MCKKLFTNASKRQLILLAIELIALAILLFILILLIINNNTPNDSLHSCPEGTHEACGLVPGECPCVENTQNGHYGLDKPMIYLYPQSEMSINVRVGAPEKLTTTYPKYSWEEGWNVLAKPNGDLVDEKTGRELYGLYWEGEGGSFRQTEEGFVVKGEEVATFLEEKLSILGLTEHEADEFIIYWLPQMEHNDYNYIRFATNEEIETNMPLAITPKPDTTIRILMITKSIDSPISVKEQQLNRVNRFGYTAVEWGGTVL